MDNLNVLLGILGQSKPFVTEQECLKAVELLHSLERNWKTAKVALNLTETMPPKYHYLDLIFSNITSADPMRINWEY